MPDQALRGRHILIVEDEYMLAEELRTEFEDAGACVLGPVGHLSQALDLVATMERIDAAILDVNLGGENVFPVVDRLMSRDVPIIFTTGYDAAVIPVRYQGIPRCEKPVNITKMARTLESLLPS